jgi:leucyl aminopeptidase
MDIKVISGDITQAKSDVLILIYFENAESAGKDTARVDQALEGAISQLVKQGEIKGKFKEITVIYTLGKLPSSKVAIVGIGEKTELSLDKIRIAVAEVCKMLRQKSPERVDLVADGIDINGIDNEAVGQAITEGALLGTYTFRKHITKAPDYKEIRQFNILSRGKKNLNALDAGCRRGKIVSEAVVLVRDMVNEPGNILTPTSMAEIARQLGQKYNLDVTVLNREEMHNLGMGGITGVAQGSQQPPKLIVMSYKGKETDDLDIALIGKGITFDSGGISLKPSENMGEMKGDMAGGASVIGAISAIAQFKPRINVAAIVPATENLPSGTAMRPGDIIKIMNGKTVEIISTDAEGRLILADALSYGRKMGARKLIDVATLTGSCRIALGDVCSGAFGNNQELINKVVAAGSEAGECIWPMPMNDEYKEQNKSDVADIKNTGGRYAGGITAALFLAEFVDSAPWVHLDIAGTNMIDKDRGYQIKGATGVPVRTLVNLVLSLAEK